MAQISAFFNSQVDENGDYDREYLAETFASYFASFIGNGVFPNPSNGLQVMASSGMNVVLPTGKAWINGYWYNNTDSLLLTHAPASGTLNRIDAIVLRWSASGRSIVAAVKQGIAALTAQAPLPQRDADIYELVLAHVYINRNVITLTQTSVVDKRLDSTVCGIVHGTISQIDTTTLGNQLQTFINEYMARYEVRYHEFLIFIESLKDLCNQAFQGFQSHILSLESLSNQEYQGFLDYILNLKATSQNERDAYTSLIAALSQDANTAHIGFIDWLNAKRITAQDEVESLLDDLRDLIDQEDIGNLLLEVRGLQSLNASVSLGTIEHNLCRYPHCVLYETTWAAGVGGAGNGPAGGTSVISINGVFSNESRNSLEVYAPAQFSNCTVISKISDTEYAFLDQDSDINVRSLLLVLN